MADRGPTQAARATVGLASLATLLLLAATSCRRSKDPLPALDAGGGTRPEAWQCAVGPPLPLGRFALDWSGEDRSYRLEAYPNGEVKQVDRVVARVSGSCILDPAGGVLWSVSRSGSVQGPDEDSHGAFAERGTLRDVYGQTRDVGEVLLLSDPQFSAATSPDGAVLAFSDGQPATTTTMGAEGDFVRARRTVLLLARTAGFYAPEGDEPSYEPRTRRLPRAKECEGPPLPRVPFELDLGSQAGAHRVRATRQGEVYEDGKLTARVTGACVLDPKDGVLAAVEHEGTVRGDRGGLGESDAVLGTFRKAAGRGDGGGADHPTGEALVGADGASTWIAPDGSLRRVEPLQTAATATGARVESGGEAASRTALVLFELERTASGRKQR